MGICVVTQGGQFISYLIGLPEAVSSNAINAVDQFPYLFHWFFNPPWCLPSSIDAILQNERVGFSYDQVISPLNASFKAKEKGVCFCPVASALS